MNYIKMHCIKLLFFCFILCGTKEIISAGLNITADFETNIRLFLDSGEIRSGTITPSMVFTTDAIFAGFSSLQWKGLDGNWYEVRLGIKGIEEWHPMKISSNNTVFVGGNSLYKGFGPIVGYQIK